MRISKRSPGKHLRATLKRLGLERPGLGWYEATRHTFASQWVLGGGSIEVLKEILGHYSVVVTERYTYLRPDLFADRERSTIPLALNPAAAPSVQIGQSLGSGNRKPPRNPAIPKTKGRSGPVSRGLDGVITPARGWCASVLIPSGNASAVLMGAFARLSRSRATWGQNGATDFEGRTGQGALVNLASPAPSEARSPTEASASLPSR